MCYHSRHSALLGRRGRAVKVGLRRRGTFTPLEALRRSSDKIGYSRRSQMELDSSPLRIVPLGGLGEVGMNCLALEVSGKILVIDCGTTFPADDYGIDVVHARFDWLLSNADRVVALCLTHGHEDHIGAVPYLLRQLSVPVHGPRHALRLVERRLRDVGMDAQLDLLHELPLGRETALGPFRVESIRMSHSIVDATSLCITTPAGRVVHSGDFKFDPAPTDGEPTDEERLYQLGQEGVDLLLSDSTNADSPGFAGSEQDVEEALDQFVRGAPRRVVVALFASNVQRLISLGRIAQRRGRRIGLLGRGLASHVEIATSLGYLDWQPSLIVPNERVKTYPPAELLLLASGTQAEVGSAMARLADGSHRWLELQPGDRVVFSSRVIPGSERAVSRMVDGLLRRGVEVVGKEARQVHTSGHAHRDEQRHLIDLLNPKCFVPVHGTLHLMRRHAELARAAGVPEVLVVENGQSVYLEAAKLRQGDPVPTGTVHVELCGTALGDEGLKARRDMGRCGVAHVSLVCDRRLRLCGEPLVATSGLPRFDEQPELARELVVLLQRRFRGADDVAEVAGEVKRIARQWFERAYRLRPVVLVHVHRMEA